MQLGKIIGRVVATQKYEGLQGKKFLLVQLLNKHGKPRSTPVVAVDTVMAGLGDVVHIVLSREAALALDPTFVPVDHAIVGIVDSVDLAGGA